MTRYRIVLDMTMNHWNPILILLLLLFLRVSLYAQQDSLPTLKKQNQIDSVKVSKHSPTTAMLLSIIPGGGQVYNKKYWKLPIIYGCLATSSYFIYRSANQMVSYRREYINRRDGYVDYLKPEYAQYNDENIINLKNKAQRNMEIAVGVTAVLYALNIIDAMVDAHLYEFDISDDLSLRWNPSVMAPPMAGQQPSYGVSLNFNF